jgi:hypothetical protein
MQLRLHRAVLLVGGGCAVARPAAGQCLHHTELYLPPQTPGGFGV